MVRVCDFVLDRREAHRPTRGLVWVLGRDTKTIPSARFGLWVPRRWVWRGVGAVMEVAATAAAVAAGEWSWVWPFCLWFVWQLGRRLWRHLRRCCRFQAKHGSPCVGLESRRPICPMAAAGFLCICFCELSSPSPFPLLQILPASHLSLININQRLWRMKRKDPTRLI